MQGCPHSVSRKGSEIRASSGQLAVSVFACAPLPSPRALAPPGSSSTAICSGFFWPHLHPVFSIPTTAAPKTPCAFFPKLVLSKISLCSTPQASVGRSGASAPPPPAHPSAPPQPLRPAPPLRGARTCCGSSCLPPVAAPHPAPGSLALVSKVTQRLCPAVLPLPASRFLLCLWGGWKRGWGLLERWCGLPSLWSLHCWFIPLSPSLAPPPPPPARSFLVAPAL